MGVLFECYTLKGFTHKQSKNAFKSQTEKEKVFCAGQKRKEAHREIRMRFE